MLFSWCSLMHWRGKVKSSAKCSAPMSALTFPLYHMRPLFCSLPLLLRMIVRATLLFSSQRAAERLLVLTNPCWSLPIGCSLVHRGWIESTITLHPAKGEDMTMSATTTKLASLIEDIPMSRNGSWRARQGLEWKVMESDAICSRKYLCLDLSTMG